MAFPVDPMDLAIVGPSKLSQFSSVRYSGAEPVALILVWAYSSGG